VTGAATPVADRLSAVRLVSFIPASRDAVRVGLLSLDATEVIDLAPFGMNDALEALAQLEMLRRAAGAIVHGPTRTAFAIDRVHLVAPIPLARSVVAAEDTGALHFADPSTLHGPGSHLSRTDAAAARGGLAAVVGATLTAGSELSDAMLDDALIGSVVVLGWPQPGHDEANLVAPGAVGPFLAVPQRSPESILLRRVAPLAASAAADEIVSVAAPDRSAFRELARSALRSHTLRPGDLLAIFPALPDVADRPPMLPGAWVRVSAPGLGTLSLAVR
jgi:hypothetical protein